MLKTAADFLVNESGATAIEYSLLAALVAVAGLAGLEALGESLLAAFERVSSSLENATPPA